MTELTETEYRTLRMKTLTILGELGARDNATATAIAAGLVSAVEAIVRERVRDAQRQAWEEGACVATEDYGCGEATNPYLGSAA